MDVSQPSPVAVEVMDAPTPQADLVAGRVAPVAVQASTARPRKRQGNIVVQSGALAVAAGKARPPAAVAAANPVQVVPTPPMKMHKVAGVKRKKATTKGPASTAPPPPPIATPRAPPRTPAEDVAAAAPRCSTEWAQGMKL
jgi:hypothetical protein